MPKVEAHIIWQKKKGLIMLLYFPAKWKAAVIKTIDKNINVPPKHINNTSIKPKDTGLIIEIKILINVKGKIK